MSSSAQGYVHISVRNARRRAERARMVQEQAHHTSRRAESEAMQSDHARADGQVREPSTMMARDEAHPGLQPVAQETEARGFVIYVGMDEGLASAAGTSLTRLANELRHYVESLVPGADTHAAVAVAPAGAAGDDLEVVRQVLGDPTMNAGVRPDLAQPPAPVSTRQPGVLIDLARREVLLDGEPLNLTFKEFELLNYLIDNGSRTVNRDELLHALWDESDEVPNERTIDVHIRRLRSKLGRLSGTVRTVRGQGYRFYEHPEVVVWAAPEYSI
ncbi:MULTISPECIES: winged helix-turn-helix domain-containing protein [Auritidibacter]|uniref:Winged helix-turn-helix domain-containing protein n=1 Tax=Auritidibacter ignavus TaxID=678932 RepID=A0AAJ6AF36_9MICC|nr:MULTISPECIES: winged helix-turn-helix domain-containing protein [Auritidibacter]PXA81619.1 transcriptional regulator [Auritidibacter sp. NML120779]AXR74149.1 winged helix family transcriptional regulator [Auritidibacter sp. NML130574]NIH71949.1 DNA-binding winged helix-turn-helix (wHTH) protein [Auritidibacter ignavus]PXA75583.1 transcriptional regulator [Auritidibacter sp. NML100628]PXA79916.1 transcriptional regulator [Auritidibacter sp. NML120636]